MNDAARRARQGSGWALGTPLIKKCAILATGTALDQLYAGKCDECCAMLRAVARGYESWVNKTSVTRSKTAHATVSLDALFIKDLRSKGRSG
ncbi:hypothetical protein F0170_25150 [Pseudomonas sp. MAFF 730085]|uniref:Uncharacterized protein n=1 Tax=Pseudomonas kitaguniensis TaxID=2607908 RepID=A0A5N7K049_9PSED|nr:hypothetical protein [Pseudomonas kitaguniensis]MPR03153.1 hypothetical protein [Pseudomonas kitaguniensis]